MAQPKSNRRVATTAPSENTKLQKIKYSKEDEPDFYKCPACGMPYKKLDDNFPASQSELYAGWDYHLPICKRCMDRLFEHYTEGYGGDEDTAIRRICEKFDIYYSVSLLNASRKITKTRSRIHTYVSKANLVQYKGKTYDTTLDEERNNTINSIDDFDMKKAKGDISTTKTALKRWGIGIFADNDYSLLEEHYKMLKDNNPNADNNQEIFIKSLCHLNLLMMKALKNNDLDGYAKANSEYAKTFKQAGLRTVEEKDASNDETFCMTLGFISEFTPEEFYQDKSLYKDFDKIGEYIDRHITRPMINLETGSDIRDKEFFVPEVDEYEEE
ncbi:MAG: hypothetical protein K2N61_14075 [Lachnospiraceae bacterium]|nr:hypothetical protein [Lachnospiraceae bacterium]